jgi:hypothetical protein
MDNNKNQEIIKDKQDNDNKKHLEVNDKNLNFQRIQLNRQFDNMNVVAGFRAHLVPQYGDRFNRFDKKNKNDLL